MANLVMWCLFTLGGATLLVIASFAGPMLKLWSFHVERQARLERFYGEEAAKIEARTVGHPPAAADIPPRWLPRPRPGTDG